jgi:hypothetical protein
LEKEWRFFIRIMTHFDGMISIITANTIDPAHRKNSIAAANWQTYLLCRLDYIISHLGIFLFTNNKANGLNRTACRITGHAPLKIRQEFCNKKSQRKQHCAELLYQEICRIGFNQRDRPKN